MVGGQTKSVEGGRGPCGCAGAGAVTGGASRRASRLGGCPRQGRWQQGSLAPPWLAGECLEGASAHLAALILVLLGQVCARLQGLDLGAAGQGPGGGAGGGSVTANRVTQHYGSIWPSGDLALITAGCEEWVRVSALQLQYTPMCPASLPITRTGGRPRTYLGPRGVQFCQPPDSQAGQVVCLVGGHGYLGESTRAEGCRWVCGGEGGEVRKRDGCSRQQATTDGQLKRHPC